MSMSAVTLHMSKSMALFLCRWGRCDSNFGVFACCGPMQDLLQYGVHHLIHSLSGQEVSSVQKHEFRPVLHH